MSVLHIDLLDYYLSDMQCSSQFIISSLGIKTIYNLIYLFYWNDTQWYSNNTFEKI